MPPPGTIWRHVTFGTKRSWNPADPRGFRSRRHRIHSSGDYRNPPPKHEHARLREHLNAKLHRPIFITQPLRSLLGQQLVAYLHTQGHPIVAAAVGCMHAHLLVALPIVATEAKRIIGRAKAMSSLAVRCEMPGRIWADGGDFKPVRDASHYERARQYIRFKQEPDAWTWWWPDGLPGAWLERVRR
ncbi:hypothetical protein ACERK3_05345 [Phycisphaerales bacterium AB-hyl4]|uniref:Transposase IS200-like domain-containing protein n=1 Tax=Natronomicrosphaera hydrolytica TaxID=3242702 RepID=A0ABV4U4F2_9BACT